MSREYDIMLFDLDGTLLDTNELIIQTFMHVFHNQPEVTRERIISHFGMPLEKQLLDYAGRRPDESGADLVLQYRTYNNAHHDEMVRAFPGVVDTLQHLHEAGVQIGVVTSKIRYTAQRGLKHVGIDAYVQATVTIEDVSKPKPDAESIHLALRQLGAKPTDRVLMIGDSPFDMGCARNAGVDSCLVGWSLKDETAMAHELPTITIESMFDLLQFVPKRRAN
jgi:pyrophosphatase PpaX